MKSPPRLPDVAGAPHALFDSGHLWILELVDGRWVRFAVDGNGVVRFADGAGTYDPWDEPPVLRHAARHVRERFDADAFLGVVDDPGDHVFVGVATVHNGVAYDFDRLPGFLGYEVWDGAAFLPPDRAERAFERLGLDAANTFDREVDARHFDPDGYEVPASAWYPGPAFGVVFRNKTGDRAVKVHPDLAREERDPVPSPVSTDPDADAADLAARYVTDERVEAARLEASEAGESGFEAVRSRVFAAVVREHADVLVHGGERETPDLEAFREAVAERVGRRLD